jgi:hypothetical protein
MLFFSSILCKIYLFELIPVEEAWSSLNILRGDAIYKGFGTPAQKD